MPAAAVIPAPIVYVNVAAFKKLVVGSRASCPGALLAQLGTMDAVFCVGSRGALDRVSRCFPGTGLL